MAFDLMESASEAAKQTGGVAAGITEAATSGAISLAGDDANAASSAADALSSAVADTADQMTSVLASNDDASATEDGGALAKRNDLIVEVINGALKVPGVKVDRTGFLSSAFNMETSDTLQQILEHGPVEAGCDRESLQKLAKSLVNKRTLESSGASFLAGIPGGAAAVGTIPADIAQFYGVALRLVQEIAYLYGMEDLWEGGEIDSERVMNTFIIYLGVMLGAGGASATLRAMSSALAAQAMAKLPQKALTKTFYYPIIKSIAKVFGKNMTKEIFAKGVSKAIPIIGGVASGGLTLVTMRPMGMNLVNCLDEAKYAYTEDDLENDLEEIQEVISAEIDGSQDNETAAEVSTSFEKEISDAKALLDTGAITEEEYSAIKARIISRL